MMEGRNKHGQFEKGRSGNPAGRPPKRPRTRTTIGYRLSVLEVGNKLVAAANRETGEVEEVTAVEAMMMTLLKKGLSGHVPSAKAFLEKYAEAARINGELTYLHHGLMEQNARLELENDKLRAMVQRQNGGVVHVAVSDEEAERLVGIRINAWENRKGSVEPGSG